MSKERDENGFGELIQTIAIGFEQVAMAITMSSQNQIDLDRLHAIRLQSDNLVAAMTALASLANAPAASQSSTENSQQKE